MDKINIPLKLSNTRVWRTYLGGKLIEALHGNFNADDTHFPEEWIMSVVTARNPGREHIKDEGISIVEEYNMSLKSFVEVNPSGILGEKHYNYFGTNTGVLIKLLDSAERLAIQVHPDNYMAKKFFNSEYGKTECWYILDSRVINGEKPCIYLGFKDGITKDYWKKVFHKQDIPEMLNCLHRFDVKSGDTFLVNGGIPHAIGPGCLLVEIQQPTDFTLRTELTTPSGFKISDELCHQGIGFEGIFDCFNYICISDENVKKFKIPQKLINASEAYNEYEIIGYNETPYFCMKKLEIFTYCDISTNDVFAGIYILSGEGELFANGISKQIAKAQQLFVPASTGVYRFINKGDVPLTVIICNGPKQIS